jgi:hypothetical protein
LIDSVISSKWVRASLSGLVLAPLLLLVACGDRQDAGIAPPPPPPRPLPKPEVAPPPAAPAGAGLLPLPSPQQVVASVPVGRRDPFGRITPPVVSLAWAPPGSDPYLAAAKVAAAGGGAEQQQRAAYEAARKTGAAGGGSTPSAAGPGGATAGAGRSGAPRRPAVPAFPQPFSVTGVIRSGGLSEATVTYGGASGNVRPGDRGGAATPWLPGGWTVASIDVDRGQLVLSRGPQRFRVQI